MPGEPFYRSSGPIPGLFTAAPLRPLPQNRELFSPYISKQDDASAIRRKETWKEVSPASRARRCIEYPKLTPLSVGVFTSGVSLTLCYRVDSTRLPPMTEVLIMDAPKPHQILIIDDDPFHLEIYGMLVQQAGYAAVPVLVRFSGFGPLPGDGDRRHSARLPLELGENLT